MITLKMPFDLNPDRESSTNSIDSSLDQIKIDRLSQQENKPRKKESPKTIDEYLEKCENYSDVFKLVKKSVKRTINRWRVGLMLVLDDLPLQIGAYHVVGSNSIIINRRLLEAVQRSSKARKEVNSYLFLVLMHEYLHSLGFIDEKEVRGLAYQIAAELLGEEHPVTHMALKGPLTHIERMEQETYLEQQREPELIPDFERTSRSYIS
jgi:hypothetical protein